MPIVWPSSLPPLQESVAGTYQEEFAEGTYVQEMDAGPPKSRKKPDVEPDVVRIEQILTAPQAGVLEEFYKRTTAYGSLLFTGPHPRTGSAKQYKFEGGVRLLPYNGLYYRAAFQLFVLPILTVPGKTTWVGVDEVRFVGGQVAMRLSWTTPDPGGLTILGYRVDWAPDQVSWRQAFLLPRQPTTDVEVIDTDSRFLPGATIYLSIRARNAIGNGEWSQALAVQIPAKIPEAPRNLQVTDRTYANGTATLTMNWDAPTSDGGSAITEYAIEIQDAGGTPLSTVGGLTGTSHTLEVPSAAGLTRQFVVLARNVVGDGPPSNSVVETFPNVPAAVSDLAVEAFSVTATDLSFTLAWTDPVSTLSLTGYVIDYSFDEGTWTTIVTETAPFANPKTFSLLPSVVGANDDVFFRIRFMNALGDAAWSNVASQTIPLLGETQLPKTSTEYVRAKITTGDGDLVFYSRRSGADIGKVEPRSDIVFTESLMVDQIKYNNTPSVQWTLLINVSGGGNFSPWLDGKRFRFANESGAVAEMLGDSVHGRGSQFVRWDEARITNSQIFEAFRTSGTVLYLVVDDAPPADA